MIGPRPTPLLWSESPSERRSMALGGFLASGGCVAVWGRAFRPSSLAGAPCGRASARRTPCRSSGRRTTLRSLWPAGEDIDQLSGLQRAVIGTAALRFAPVAPRISAARYRALTGVSQAADPVTVRARSACPCGSRAVPAARGGDTKCVLPRGAACGPPRGACGARAERCAPSSTALPTSSRASPGRE